MKTHALLSTSVLALAASSASAQIEMRKYVGAAAHDHFGWAVSVVGDVDGDGKDDLAIGAPGRDGSLGVDVGRVIVVSGRTSQTLRTWDGLGPQDFFGQAIAPVGDLDGDGFADVLVGAPEADHPAFFGAGGTYGNGYAHVLSGATGLPLLSITASGKCLGAAVAAGGDVNGDGVTELLIGGPGGSGSVLVVNGASGAILRTHTPGPGTGGWFGHSVTFLGDLQNDGADEYAIGAIETQTNNYKGRVRAYDGASGAQLWEVLGSQPDDEFGFSIARIGDCDGDGFPELVVGARQDGFPSPVGRGYVRVLSGATGSSIAKFFGSLSAWGMGFSVAAIGDVDGDGLEDFAASQPGADDFGYAFASAVRVFAGDPLQELFKVPQPATKDFFGVGLHSGDATGDGLRDLVIGEPYADEGGMNAGRVFAYTAVRSVVTYCEAQANSQGCTPAISGVGTPSATLLSPFRIRAMDVLNGKKGLLFYGFKPRQTPFLGGFMCIVAPTVRTPVQDSGGNPPPSDCSGFFSFDFNEHIRSGIDPKLVPGEEVFAQYWSRDPPAASSSNLTDALAFYIHP
jgi:hypothetical protein